MTGRQSHCCSFDSDWLCPNSVQHQRGTLKCGWQSQSHVFHQIWSLPHQPMNPAQKTVTACAVAAVALPTNRQDQDRPALLLAFGPVPLLLSECHFVAVHAGHVHGHCARWHVALIVAVGSGRPANRRLMVHLQNIMHKSLRICQNPLVSMELLGLVLLLPLHCHCLRLVHWNHKAARSNGLRHWNTFLLHLNPTVVVAHDWPR